MPRSPKVVDGEGKAWLRVELSPELKERLVIAVARQRTTLTEFVSRAITKEVAAAEGGVEDALPTESARPRRKRGQ